MKKILASSVFAVLSVMAANFTIQDYKQDTLIVNNTLTSNVIDEAQTVDNFLKSIPSETYNTQFEAINSEYLNVKLNSSESIYASLGSVPEMIIIRLDASEGAMSTNMIISGFSPLTEYHKYEDDYTNHEVFTADENGNYAFTQDISKAHLIFIQPRPSTISIYDNATGGDCILKNIGVWDVASKTCTLITNVNETVQIQNHGITLDGAGFSIIGTLNPVTGNPTGNGVFFNGKNNVTVKNLIIRNFSYGIFAYYTNGSNIINNSIESKTTLGILIDYRSSNVNISGNSVKGSGNGIVADNVSSNINISDNTVTGNTYGILAINGTNNSTITNNTVLSNNIWGIFVYGNGNTITGNIIEKNDYGLYFYDSSNNKAYNNNFINNWPYQAYNQSSRDNAFNLDAPVGGNYWSNWTSPDANNDRFVDNPYVFNGGRDNLPWAVKNGWLDSIAPVTTINLSGTMGENDWYTSAVEISFAALDNEGGTGVDKIQYGWDGLTWLNYSTPFTINDNGIKKIYYRSIDKTGNMETTQSKDVNIDTIAPISNASMTGTQGTNNWYISDVAAVISSIDNTSGSGIKAIEYSYDNITWNVYYSVITISTEGAQTIYFKSKDKAGNIEIPVNRPISIDKTLPVISGKTIQPPNINNWYNQNVIIEFLCTDMVSGVVNPVTNDSITTEGAGQSSTGNCTDKAGNSSSLVIDGINIDKTNPQVSVVRSPEPNAKGWNNTSVIATFIATDSLSNIDGASTNVVNFNLEGVDQEAKRTFKDKAGNEVTGSISGVNIDLTTPVINGSATSAPNINGWYSSNVNVHFTGSDGLSGLASISPDAIISSEGENREATGTAEDNAGNSSSFTVGGINLDKTSPVITGSPMSPSNTNNWYNSAVKIQFIATDILSGIANLSPITVISQEGLDQTANGSAEDKAGNSSSTIVSGINLDTTSPSTEISLSGNDKCQSGAINISFTAIDVLSGIEKTTYNLNGEGWLTYTGPFAVSDQKEYSIAFKSYDKADNAESEQVKSFTIEKSVVDAAIKFSPDKKDIIVFNIKDGTEANYIILPSKKVNDDDDNDDDDDSKEQGWALRKYMVKNCSGNSVSIIIKHKMGGKEIKAKIVSIQYDNEGVIEARKNNIAIQYSLSKNGTLKEMEQNISLNKRFDIDAKYSAHKDQTVLSIKLAGKRDKKLTKNGLLIPAMVITNGSLKYQY